MKKRYLILALFLGLTFLVAGCGALDPNVKKPDIQEEEQPQELTDEIYSTDIIEKIQNKYYTIEMTTLVKVKDEELEVETETVVNGDESATTMKLQGASLTTILKDNKSYMIMHEQSTIVEGPIPEEPDPGLDQIDFNSLQFIEKGKTQFLEKERIYEDYKMDDDTVRFYFNNKELDGIEVVTSDMITIMDIDLFENTVDMGAFEMPDEYAEIKQ